MKILHEKQARSTVQEDAKVFYQQNNIGKAKYVISFHDGEKTYDDGSPFYDLKTFKSKAERDKFVKDLFKQGYIEK